jgi:hypothetical protein
MKRNGPGRPPLPHPQDALLAVRMRHELRDAAELAAERAGETLPEWIRRIIAEAAAKAGA